MHDERACGFPELSSRVQQRLSKTGHRFTAAAFFSSWSNEYVRQRLIALSQLVLPHMWVDLLEMRKGIVRTPKVRTHIVDERVVLDGEGEDKSLQGTYLVVGLPVEDEKVASEAFRAIDHFVGLCRLFFGSYVVREAHLRGVWSVETKELIQASDGVLLDPLPPPELLDLIEVIPKGTPAIHISRRAAELVGIASQTTDRALRFLTLWTAVEVQIGSGDKRKKLCLDTLKSDVANRQLLRLQRLRSAFLKDGETISFTAFDEYCLISLLRLATVTNKIEQSSLCTLFERRVTDEKDFPKYSSYKVGLTSKSEN